MTGEADTIEPQALPLSAAQQGIWLGQQLTPGSALYNAAECVALDGELDADVFSGALRRACSEADVLRARFVEASQEVRQLVDGREAAPPVRLDLRGELDAHAAADAWMARDLAVPFDLREGPVHRAALLRIGDARHLWYQCAHHVALDGFGFALIARRVAELYASARAGRAAPPCRFGSLRSVVEEDAAYRASEACARDMAFFREYLAERPPPATLTERPAPFAAPARRRSALVSGEAMGALERVARASGCTWGEVMIALLALHVHRATGAREVVLGLPVMGRIGSAALRVPCMAMNIVPLRVAVAGELSLAALVREVGRGLRLVRPHARYRYEQLRRDLGLVGGGRRLFGPVINLMPFDYDLRFGDLGASAHNVAAGPVEDLSIGVYARADGRGLRVDFDGHPEAYDDDDLERHQAALFALLAQHAERPEAPLGVGTSRARRAASVLSGPALAAPPVDVVARIRSAVARRPQAIAVVAGAEETSYAALWAEASAIAARLGAHAIGRDRIVALCLPRGRQAIAAMLGVLLAGAAYLPLDPNGPLARTERILDDARPALILTDAEGAARLPSYPVLRIERLVEEPSPDESPSVVAPSAPEALAYVIYTSGSTGEPNGVLVERGALAHFVGAAQQRYAWGVEERVLQFAPLHFDASVEEVFLTLSAGGTLVLRDDALLHAIPRLLEACALHRISVLDLPTAYWHELAYFLSSGGQALPASVATVIIGGEAAQPDRVARFRRAVGPRVRLFNTYGPTEATVVATSAVLSGEGEVDAPEEAPIGVPLPGVTAAVVTADGRLAAEGELGELHLLGPGLARGYLRRPELERRRFVELHGLPGSPRAYRTGDLVRVRGDGQLAFVGRVDDELKISGHRIDPREVEAVLLRHPAVREACVVAQAVSAGDKQLIAHVVPADDERPAEAELRRHARTWLLGAAIPARFVLAPSLPRTSSGKIDRRALASAAAAAPVAAAAESASPLAELVLTLFREVLGTAALGVGDDFFERGGHSLQAIQVANRLGVKLGREVAVPLVFRHPTASELAAALASESDAPAASLPDQLLRDAVLPPDVVVERAAPPGRAPCRVILTGATGFVGVHLLHELLVASDARIVCLVRAGSADEGRARVASALSRHALAAPGFHARVEICPSDLAAPGLGLDADRWEELARDCDAIFHDAAAVSLARGYASLRAVNVRGTLELLRLACARVPKPFHYVSTLAVAAEPRASLLEERFVPLHAGLRDGYAQSKWAAERLVEQAIERGIDARVYRLGRVVGPEATGYVNPEDIVFRLLIAGIRAGAGPLLEVREPWTPVDYVARAISGLSRARVGEQRVFHLAPAPLVRLGDVLGWVRAYGYALEAAAPDAFRARLAASEHAADAATHALLELHGGGEGGPLGFSAVRCDAALAALGDRGPACPAVTPALVHRYLDHCVATGLLPTPEAQRARLRQRAGAAPRGEETAR